MSQELPTEACLKDGRRVVLRRAGTEDAESFSRYLKEVFRTSPWVITQTDEFDPDVERQRRWISEFDSCLGSVLILALHDGSIVGNIDLRMAKNRRRLAHRGTLGMAVLANYRGVGLGKTLMKTMIDLCQKEDSPIERIDLGVLAPNKPAIALYHSFGFKTEGVFQGSLKTAEGYIDELYMSLWVKPPSI